MASVGFSSGKHQRVRKFPGIKGRRPDLKASRKAVADENMARREEQQQREGRAANGGVISGRTA